MKKDIAFLCVGCILGILIAEVFNVLKPHSKPEASRIVFLEIEDRASLQVPILISPLSCPDESSMRQARLMKLSKGPERAWKEIEQAASHMDRTLFDLTLEAVRCDTAFQGWTFATSQWEAVCNGDRKPCI